jgi:hypothetical protein
MKKIKKQIEYNVCPWCEDSEKMRPHCRKTYFHANYMAQANLKVCLQEIKIALKKDGRNFLKSLKRLFRL